MQHIKWLNFPLLVLVSLLMTTLACNLVSTDEDVDNPLVIEKRPAIVLLAPANDNLYAAGATVTLHAIARDLEGQLVRIEFIIMTPGEDITLVKEADTPQEYMEAVVEWEAFGNQTYPVEAIAVREDGTGSNVAGVIIRVRNVDGNMETPAVDDDSGETTGEATSQPETTNSPAAPLVIDETLLGETVNGRVEALDLPVRTEPQTSAPEITQLQADDPVEVVGRSSDGMFYLIRIEGGFGWVFGSFISTSGDTAGLPAFE